MTDLASPLPPLPPDPGPCAFCHSTEARRWRFGPSTICYDRAACDARIGARSQLEQSAMIERQDRERFERGAAQRQARGREPSQ